MARFDQDTFIEQVKMGRICGIISGSSGGFIFRDAK